MRLYTDKRLAEGIVKLHNLMAGKPDGKRIDEIMDSGELFDRAKEIRDVADSLMNRVGQIENGL